MRVPPRPPATLLAAFSAVASRVAGVTRTYRCQACGATWVSYPAGEAIERTGRCLRCEGDLVLTQPDADVDAHAMPPVPNGEEDDSET